MRRARQGAAGLLAGGERGEGRERHALALSVSQPALQLHACDPSRSTHTLLASVVAWLEWYIKLFLGVHFAANWVSVH